MTEVEKEKMPGWQKAFCVVLALISLERLYSFRLLLLAPHGIAWVPGARLDVLEAVMSNVLSFLFAAFFFLVLVRHWMRDEPL